ncbi:COX15/CtaA family protein [Fodinibius salsisoli]|uniref:COX15/CtaA family protein n=1 Tax=Fodinibius salsisoli TaxID=2820877 RepID=A0ABT3PP93_9BACT|nr:COX15/CtaA family protein [Fodinibius salsisoli]MCW9707678.1 COX15/CtaA family protein [Fodinibius salsisoli]
MTLNTYQKVALTTVGATIFLIFVGGLVRASGAGLGCPDWPKCFGMWIPPTTVAELPPGFDASAFNALKTWTEYINRLIGAIIGLLITATFVLSFRYREEESAVFYNSGAAFVLVLVQGWLGGQVVITGLNEWLITLHMLLAMFIMMILIFAVFKASEQQFSIQLSRSARRWLLISGGLLLLITFVQLSIGTQVREAIDLLKNMASPPDRATWISQVGSVDELHRSFSWGVLICGAITLYFARWHAQSPLLSKIGNWIFGLLLFQTATGIGLYYLGMPPVYQVVHLVGIALIIALEFVLLLLVMQADEKHAVG